MSQQDPKRRPAASLTELLAEHTRVAEQERQELEARLRAREEEERRAREEEERRQKELLQQRLAEEKRRAEMRFQRQQARETEPERPAAPVPAPQPAAQAREPAAPRRGRLALAVAATVVVTAGLAVGAWALFLSDTRPDRAVVRHMGAAMVTQAGLAVDAQQARHAAQQHAAEQAGALVALEQRLATARADIGRLEAEMTETQKQAAADRKRAEESTAAAEESAAAAAAAAGKPAAGKPKRPPRPTGILYRPGALTGGDIR
jgi:hypothetical protein